MTMLEANYSVTNLYGFEEELEAIKKKYKVTADYIVTGTHTKTFTDGWSEQEYKVRFTDLTLYINIPGFQIEGFDYLGCIKDEFQAGLFTVHGNKVAEEKGITIREFIKSFEEIPCNHCNRNHRRVIGHIFREQETGELKIYGSGCAKKYFGLDFLRMLNRFERIRDRIHDFAEEDRQGVGTYGIDAYSIFSLAYYLISKHGYLSRSADVDGDKSTPYMVTDMYNDRDLAKQIRQEVREAVQDVDFGRVLEFDFIDGKDKENDHLTDFEHNMLIMQERIDMGLIVPKDIGFLVYMVYAVFFKQPKKEKRVWNDSPDYNKGDKIKDLELTLINMTGWEGYYGWTNIYIFEGPNNTQFKWFSGVELTGIGEEWQGKKVHVNSATVKDIDNHPDFGTSVVLTRCRMK